MGTEKIRLVDDDSDILEVVRTRLENEGYAVATALTAEEAEAKAGNEAFHLVITDLKLGASDGLTLMERLLGLYPDLPVIILTGFGSIEGAVAAIQRGAYSYLTKPFDPKELLL